jgi:two-component SAPR family response regulator
MAPRLDTLASKTVYIIDVRFPGTEILFDEMQKWFAANMPELKTIVRQKKGDYFENDPELWAEIKEKAHAVIMGVGH